MKKVKSSEIFMSTFVGLAVAFMFWIIYEFGKNAVDAVSSSEEKAFIGVVLAVVMVAIALWSVKVFNNKSKA